MALAGVESTVRYLGNMVVEEAKYLYEVEAKVEELQDELKWMMCFLQDVDARRDRDARIREWIRQISRLAYQCEDIFDSFILKVELQRRGGIIKKLKRYSCIMREAKALHELSSDIDALKLKISTLTSRLHTYGIRTTDQGSSSSVRNEDQLGRSYAHYEPGDTVGLEKDVKVVVNKLTAEGIKIVALCGGGGLGKTTLAKKIYHHRDIRQYFDAVAWASVSQQCHVESVVTELLQGLTSVNPEKASNGPEKEGLMNAPNANNNKTLAQLMQELCEVQKKQRCLVVLDDIWKTEAWDSLKPAFPIDKENSRGGKIMLTTRIEGVANYAEAHIHKQLVMNEEDAWLLLGKKLRCDPSNFFGEKHPVNRLGCDESEKLAKEMLEHCRGLPLAIAALGGILATKKSLKEWKTTRNNIERLLPNAKEGGLSCEKVLSLSYDDLPFHLKPCFLYLGIFREDVVISATKLIQLWMAEGFLSINSSDNKHYIHQEGSSLEELGESYLAELADRSMVQVGSTKWNGRIKTCCVHDLVRELCISKAVQENFLKVLTVGDLATLSSSISCMSPSPPDFKLNIRKGCRRLAVHGDKDDFQKLMTSIVSNRNKKSNASVHVKSLFLCGNYFPIESSIWIKAVIKQYRWLQVLYLDGFDMVSLPKEVGELAHLRYLSIRDCDIGEVPSSIVKLKSLRTLDLRRLFRVKWLPDMIWRMRQLIHVYMPNHIVKPSLVERTAYKIMLSKLHQVGQHGLLNHNIEVLCNFDGLSRLKDVAELANLRKLSIAQEIKEKEDLEQIKSSKSLSNGCLKYLFFRLRGKLLMDEPGALCDFEWPNKMKLEVLGRISLGSSSSGGCSLGPNMLPHSLTTLILDSTEIENPDAIQILEKLTNLRTLDFNKHSYMGKEMRCSDGGFPKLVYLSLCRLENLEEWTIEKGAMPSLLRLIFWKCLNLKTFPDGIKSIPNLKDLSIGEMPKHFCDKVREWKESAVEGDDRDGKGVAKEVEDRGLLNSDKVVNHHIPTINIWEPDP